LFAPGVDHSQYLRETRSESWSRKSIQCGYRTEIRTSSKRQRAGGSGCYTDAGERARTDTDQDSFHARQVFSSEFQDCVDSGKESLGCATSGGGDFGKNLAFVLVGLGQGYCGNGR
jgi:hypothetical protein